MNRIIVLFFALGILASCGQNTRKQGTSTGRDVLPITLAEFIEDAAPFVDRAVRVSGTVVHVCRHGGQRMFIIGKDGGDRVRVTTGEDIAEFTIDLEGEQVEVTGIVRELIIDETYLAEWEAEVMEGSQHDLGEGHAGGVGHGEHAEAVQDADSASPDPQAQIEEQLARIQDVRDEIAESGRDHLSDYWIETIEYRIIKD